MTTPRTRRALTALLAAAACLALTAVAFASDGEAPLSNMYATFWGLVPPIVAIVLALITKEAYSSLFIGILAEQNPLKSISAICFESLLTFLMGAVIYHE